MSSCSSITGFLHWSLWSIWAWSWIWYPVWSNIICIWPPVSLGWRPSLWHLGRKSVESKEKNSFLQSEVCPRVLCVLVPIPTAHNGGTRATDVRKEVPPCRLRLFGHSWPFTVLWKFRDFFFVKFPKSTQVSSKDSTGSTVFGLNHYLAWLSLPICNMNCCFCFLLVRVQLFLSNSVTLFDATVGGTISLFSLLEFRLLSICIERCNWLLYMDPYWDCAEFSVLAMLLWASWGCLLTGLYSADNVVPSLSSLDAPLSPCLSVWLHNPFLSLGWVC